MIFTMVMMLMSAFAKKAEVPSFVYEADVKTVSDEEFEECSELIIDGVMRFDTDEDQVRLECDKIVFKENSAIIADVDITIRANKVIGDVNLLSANIVYPLEQSHPLMSKAKSGKSGANGGGGGNGGDAGVKIECSLLGCWPKTYGSSGGGNGSSGAHGQNGSNGMSGSKGIEGEHGVDISFLVYEFDKDSSLTILTSGSKGAKGQDGQAGGNGGNGGNGGGGGRGGEAYLDRGASHGGNGGNGGKAGDGGNGGDGGHGGKGGDGGNVIIQIKKKYPSRRSLSKWLVVDNFGAQGAPGGVGGLGGVAGKVGAAGGAGRGGDGAIFKPGGGSGLAGRPGAAGKSGEKGIDGKPGDDGADGITVSPDITLGRRDIDLY